MKKIFLTFFFVICATIVLAQDMIRGVIVDKSNGEAIPFASAVYKDNHVMVASDVNGRFSIAHHNGWVLTFSAVGYNSKNVKVNANTSSILNIELEPDTKMLEGVTISDKRSRYKRKDNPAVELMRRVIAAKKRTDLANHDFYEYNKYQKLTFAFNDLQPADFEQGIFKKHQWLLNQVEFCDFNNKLVLPVGVEETVTRKVYRREPHSEKNIIMGQTSSGLNELLETGNIVNVVMNDLFTDVDVYDDQIRLLQRQFPSPIGDGAISFYRYYIVDTIKVERDSCFHLEFLPNNQQDFGFRGELYILKDSTLHVKKCSLTLPKRTGVNFIENLRIEQEYAQLADGEWVLSADDMYVELTFMEALDKFLVTRMSRFYDYSFDELPKHLFRGKRPEYKESSAMNRDKEFWNKYRGVELTRSESSMGTFLQNFQNMKGFKYLIFGLRALIENFVETGSKENPSKVDVGPINTMLTYNFIDGFRTRLSAQTTANLNSHLFWKGYYAYGWGTKRHYYNSELTYSFNKKEYLPHEYPVRSISFSSAYDVCSPSDKFASTDKDNVFTSFKWTTVNKMMFYNRQKLQFDYEQEWGLRTTLSLKTEENEACGALFFNSLASGIVPPVKVDDISGMLHNGRLRVTELSARLRIAPGEKYFNTKQRRFTVNRDVPEFTIGHTIGLKNVLGGDYRYNYTDVEVFKRFWMPYSWGNIDIYLKGGVQWNQVPFPLLITPAANLSYIINTGSFNLVNDMEFLNDRYASLYMLWDMNGKIFNRIPIIRELKWREYIGVKTFWGTLTDKNNPYLAQNAGNHTLMYFPEGSYIMDSKRPYVEIIAGVYNIFKVLSVQYVRRLNYLDLPTSSKHGIRFMFKMTF